MYAQKVVCAASGQALDVMLAVIVQCSSSTTEVLACKHDMQSAAVASQRPVYEAYLTLAASAVGPPVADASLKGAPSAEHSLAATGSLLRAAAGAVAETSAELAGARRGSGLPAGREQTTSADAVSVAVGLCARTGADCTPFAPGGCAVSPAVASGWAAAVASGCAAAAISVEVPCWLASELAGASGSGVLTGSASGSSCSWAFQLGMPSSGPSLTLTPVPCGASKAACRCFSAANVLKPRQNDGWRQPEMPT